MFTLVFVQFPKIVFGKTEVRDYYHKHTRFAPKIQVVLMDSSMKVAELVWIVEQVCRRNKRMMQAKSFRLCAATPPAAWQRSLGSWKLFMFTTDAASIEVSVVTRRSPSERSEAVEISFAYAGELYVFTLIIIITERKISLRAVAASSSRLMSMMIERKVMTT